LPAGELPAGELPAGKMLAGDLPLVTWSGRSGIGRRQSLAQAPGHHRCRPFGKLPIEDPNKEPARGRHMAHRRLVWTARELV